MRLTFSAPNPILAETKVEFLMSIDSRDFRKIVIWVLLLSFVFVAIIIPLLSLDTPDAVAAVTLALILVLEILFCFCFNPQLIIPAGYRFGIPPRSPPIC
jgi:hypothetical protein